MRADAQATGRVGAQRDVGGDLERDGRAAGRGDHAGQPPFEQLAKLPRGDDPIDGTPVSSTDSPSGPVAVTAQVLADHGRLGALLTRELAQFPAEIDSPVRIAEPIVVSLPAETIAGASDVSIVVWAIVMSDGSVDTALLADGDESLAEPVLAAVKAARFIPAVSRLQPRDYPISLEFRFAPGGSLDTADRVVSASGSAAVR